MGVSVFQAGTEMGAAGFKSSEDLLKISVKGRARSG